MHGLDRRSTVKAEKEKSAAVQERFRLAAGPDGPDSASGQESADPVGVGVGSRGRASAGGEIPGGDPAQGDPDGIKGLGCRKN